MTKLISKEQFQERIDSKHESLLAQRTQRVEEEISSILKGVALKDLSDEQQYTILKSAKYIAENKNYSEDYKLKILENIKNSAEENHFGDEINQNEGLNIFSDISNDIVYQKMVKKGDIENIKLLLERKLDVDVYLSYLNDEEIRYIGNKDKFLLQKQLEEESLDNSPSEIEKGDLEKIEEGEKEKKQMEDNTEEKVEEKIENEIKKGSFIQSLIRDSIVEFTYHGLQIDEKEFKTRSIIDVLKGKIHLLSGIGPQGGRLSDINNLVKIEIKDHSKVKAGDMIPVDFYVYGNEGFACTINVKIVSSNKQGDSKKIAENSGESFDSHIPDEIVDKYIDSCNYIIKVNNTLTQIRSPLSIISSLQGNIIDRFGESSQGNFMRAEENYREKYESQLKDERYYEYLHIKEEIEKRYKNIKSAVLKRK